MDNDILDLADRLCTVVGMLMEDNNMLAISKVDVGSREPRLEALADAVADMTTLIAAARILVRLG